MSEKKPNTKKLKPESRAVESDAEALFRQNVRPSALAAAVELTGKLSRAGRTMTDKDKGNALLAACSKHHCTVQEIAWALDFLAWEVKRVSKL